MRQDGGDLVTISHQVKAAFNTVGISDDITRKRRRVATSRPGERADYARPGKWCSLAAGQRPVGRREAGPRVGGAVSALPAIRQPLGRAWDRMFLVAV